MKSVRNPLIIKSKKHFQLLILVKLKLKSKRSDKQSLNANWNCLYAEYPYGKSDLDEIKEYHYYSMIAKRYLDIQNRLAQFIE